MLGSFLFLFFNAVIIALIQPDFTKTLALDSSLYWSTPIIEIKHSQIFFKIRI